MLQAMPPDGKSMYNPVMSEWRDTLAHRGQGPADRLFVRVFSVERRLIDRTWNAADVLSSYWRLYVNERSGASVVTTVGRHMLSPGAVHLIPAWVRFTCACDRPVMHSYVHFDVIGMPGAALRRVLGGPVRLRSSAVLKALHEALVDRLAAGSSAMASAKALTWAALDAMLIAQPMKARGQLLGEGLDRARIESALQMIEAEPGGVLDNERLAASCHVSTDHFIRLFRAAMGQTPARYVAERRIAEAGRLLLFTDDKIDAIAARTGFVDRFHFTRVFRRLMGLPPAAYRRAGMV